MSNVTFLIGNGFDLACGLKTSFTDMYPQFVKTESSNEIIDQFKRDIEADERLHFETWSDFEMGMAEYAQNWKREEELLSCLEDFTNFMIQYLSEEQESFFDRVSKQKKVEVARKLLQDLTSFNKGFTHYDAVRRIQHFLMAGNVNVNCISFNYTRVFDRFLSLALTGADTANMRIKFRDPIHIHGDLFGPVLGVDNEKQLHNVPFKLSTLGKRAFIKPYYNNEYDSSRLESTIGIIQNSDVICAFGKRFGQSDQMWNQAIWDWLTTDRSHELVYYDYRSSCFDSRVTWRRMGKEDSVRDRLINVLSREENGKELVAQQVHIPVGTRIFAISDIIEQE